MTDTDLIVQALAIRQTTGRTLYSFAIDGKKLPLFTTVSRVARDERHAIQGYQRAESLAHIRTIRTYLESADAMLPNALVVAFDDRVRFEASQEASDGDVTFGRLIIPFDPKDAAHERPGWIVDGQQRCAAIQEADVDSFPVCVTAFITASVAEQRSQFILVNSTKPLPKGLIHELLPATPAQDLPVALLKRRYPAQLAERLNYDPDSPLYKRIRTPTTVEGVIKDNSVLKTLTMSIEDGALYHFFDPDTGAGDTEAMLVLVKRYWSAVAELFPEAWNNSPRHSRLVHGVGIVSMGCLMDEITYRLREHDIPTARQYAEHLRLIAEDCRWTEGVWELSRSDRRRWNELQNIPRDIKELTDFLVRTYRRRAQEAVPVAA